MEQWTPASWVAELGVSLAQGGEAMPPTPGVTSSPQQRGRSPEQAIAPTRTSVLAISSLVIGLFWLFGLGSASAIVLGVMSLRRIARSQGTLTGKRLALAGMIVGIIGLIVSALLLREIRSNDRELK